MAQGSYSTGDISVTVEKPDYARLSALTGTNLNAIAANATAQYRMELYEYWFRQTIVYAGEARNALASMRHGSYSAPFIPPVFARDAASVVNAWCNRVSPLLHAFATRRLECSYTFSVPSDDATQLFDCMRMLLFIYRNAPFEDIRTHILLFFHSTRADTEPALYFLLANKDVYLKERHQ